MATCPAPPFAVGVDEAVEELTRSLQNPSRYQALGAVIPKACCSLRAAGNRWRRCWVSCGGRRSRSAALHHWPKCSSASAHPASESVRAGPSPCIIFVDETDAVGRQEAPGWAAAHDERESRPTSCWSQNGLLEVTPNILDRGHHPGPGASQAGARFDRWSRYPTPIWRVGGRVLQNLRGVPGRRRPDGFGGTAGSRLGQRRNEAALRPSNGITGFTGILEEAVDRVKRARKTKPRLAVPSCQR